jgi:HSP20 family protein
MADDDENFDDDENLDDVENERKKKPVKKSKKSTGTPFGFPFDMDEEQQKELNKQMQNFMSQFGETFLKGFQNMQGQGGNIDFNKIINDLSKKMNIDPSKMNLDPSKMPNMGKFDINSEEFQKYMKENMGKGGKMPGMGPFVFGMNLKMGPDGKPIIDSFGNVKPKPFGPTEVREKREPLTDIIEEDNYVIVVAEMPGVEKSRIELKASERSLTIIGSDEDGTHKYDTTLTLPSAVNPDRAKARYQNGVLEVRLLKIEDKKSNKNINVD